MLSANVENRSLTIDNYNPYMGSYLRYHRKKIGLTQKELAEIVGSLGPRQVAKHEKFQATPSIIAAIAYHVVLKASIAELFPGLHESVRYGVEQRLAEMEDRLQQSTAKGREANDIARKLVWMEERKDEDKL
jgi:transcriptional regulator with XRE-family HTH domain